MKFTLRTAFLVALVLTVSLYSCKEEDCDVQPTTPTVPPLAQKWDVSKFTFYTGVGTQTVDVTYAEYKEQLDIVGGEVIQTFDLKANNDLIFTIYEAGGGTYLDTASWGVSLDNKYLIIYDDRIMIDKVTTTELELSFEGDTDLKKMYFVKAN